MADISKNIKNITDITDINDLDVLWMQRALDLAETARYRTSPNPRVGCVLVKDGHVLGEGATQAAGSDHAEVSALKNANARGLTAKQLYGATAYVSLEPCNHTGKTPPCSQALIAAKIGRVVVAGIDPNPLTAGQGLATLRAAGIVVDTIQAPHLQKQALELNLGFFKRMQTGMPWVRLKVASSLDGYMALPNGHSQWLTGSTARTDTHHWRASSCAVVTGVGTVLADDPELTVRSVPTPRQPWRVVLDTHLRTPCSARLFHQTTQTQAPVLILHASHDLEKQAALTAQGAKLLTIPTNINLTLDLKAVITALGEHGLNELHFEAGSRLNGALLAAGLVDELMIYQAPLLLGSGLPWAKLPTPAGLPYTDLTQIARWRLHSTLALDDDVRLILRTQ